MFEQAFKRIDDVLRKEAGCTTELDYTEQTSWLLFLKYLDGLEHDLADQAALAGKEYSYILDEPHRWSSWAAPKGADGKLDHNAALTGDDLRDFVDQDLFPYLHGFKAKASGPNTVEYKIGEIFAEIKNKIQSGYNMREIIDEVDELRFRSQAEKHELSHLYEAKIKNMGNAGRNGGEYYTPRPLIRAMVKIVKPKLGETIYDGAAGSAGFLCESYEYLKASNPHRSTADDKVLQERTFYGKEKKSLAYVIAIMNLMLHGIEAPNILHTNTLTENLADVQEKDRYDVVLANPPFGGKERPEVQHNFPIRTGETAFLFLQHFIKMLKAGGRGGVVIKNTFLSNTDNASVSLRKLLLESCNLHTVLDCPSGTFQGAGVKTVVLFFEKGAPTRKIWFYQLDPGRNLGKTNPLNDDDLSEFVKLQETFADSPKSWSVDAKSFDQTTFDLSVKNPNGGEEIAHRSPEAIMDEIAALDAESAEVLGNIRVPAVKSGWPRETLNDVCEVEYGTRVVHKRDGGTVYPVYGGGGATFAMDRFNREDRVVVARFGMSEQCTRFVSGRFFLNDSGLTLSPKDPATLLQAFLNLWTFSVNREIFALGKGTAQKNLDVAAFRCLLVPVPSLAEQQRIIGILDEAFEALATANASAEQKLTALDALKKSLLHDAFIGNLQARR